MEGDSIKRQVLHRQAREIVFKVYNYFKNINEQNSAGHHGAGRNVANAQETTAEACGVSLRTVQRIVSEGKKSFNVSGTATFRSPGKHPRREKTVSELDDFNKSVLRRTVLDMYREGEFPTAKKLVKKMNEAVGFEGSETSMLRIMKGIGFTYKKCNDGRKMLMERTDIVAARTQFLRKMHGIREEGTSKIFYLDETWVNQNHTRKYCWKMSDGTGGLKVPVGKGGRLIVCHAGSAETGFIPQCKLIFKSKGKNTSTDYHSDMNSTVFKSWFVEQLLPNIPPHSTIVMDNASIHSVQLEKAPSTVTRKADIIMWLKKQNIPHSPSQNREELLHIVKSNKPQRKLYELDTIASSLGHNVVRLPPYHCHYNPIELIWAQMKGYVAERNNTFKIAEVEKLTNEAIESISTSAWENCVRHAEHLQEEDYRREISRDEIMERFVIHLRESDSEESDGTDGGISDFD